MLLVERQLARDRAHFAGVGANLKDHRLSPFADIGPYQFTACGWRPWPRAMNRARPNKPFIAEASFSVRMLSGQIPWSFSNLQSRFTVMTPAARAPSSSHQRRTPRPVRRPHPGMQPLRIVDILQHTEISSLPGAIRHVRDNNGHGHPLDYRVVAKWCHI